MASSWSSVTWRRRRDDEERADFDPDAEDEAARQSDEPAPLPASRPRWYTPFSIGDSGGGGTTAGGGGTTAGGGGTTDDTDTTSDVQMALATYDSPEAGAQDEETTHTGAQDASSTASIQSIGDAYEHCQELLKTQIERAQAEGAAMNVAVVGDARARRTLLTLLPDETLRSIFLHTSRQPTSWPRLRSLFGAPPYNFLRPEDGGSLRAAGIATGRTRLTYESSNNTAAYAQFGIPHLLDVDLREYKVLPLRLPVSSDALPFHMDRLQGSMLYMNVRLPKRSRQLLRDPSKRRAVIFPMAGEIVRVHYSSQLSAVWNPNREFVVSLRITKLLPRAPGAATATVFAIRE